MKTNKDARIATRLESSLAEEFDKLASEQDLSRAQLMRRLIREYVNKHKQEVEMKEKK